MKDEQILDNAPDGATQRTMYCYLKLDDPANCHHYDNGKWELISGSCDISEFEYYRSLADIQTIVNLKKRVAELEATVDYIKRVHNKIVGAILDLDEMEQDSEEMANAEQDLLELAKSSKVYGVPSEYRDISGAKRIAELEQNLGLSIIALDHQKTLLVSCEAALSQRDNKIAELDKNLKMLERYNGSVESLVDGLEAHNLEQQAKILNQLASETYTDTKDGCVYQMLLIQKARALTEQAKQLREGQK